jgi:hypothetical protein
LKCVITKMAMMMMREFDFMYDKRKVCRNYTLIINYSQKLNKTKGIKLINK